MLHYVTVSRTKMDDETLSSSEIFCRHCFEFAYRIALGTLSFYMFFDIMFSPLWLWGYVWSLNQNYTTQNIVDETDGYLVLYQFQLYPHTYRILMGSLATLAIYCCIKIMSFKLNIWSLYRFSVYCGLLSMMFRVQQENQRIMPLLHLGFYVYAIVFVNGFIMTVSW